LKETLLDFKSRMVQLAHTSMQNAGRFGSRGLAASTTCPVLMLLLGPRGASPRLRPPADPCLVCSFSESPLAIALLSPLPPISALMLPPTPANDFDDPINQKLIIPPPWPPRPPPALSRHASLPHSAQPASSSTASPHHAGPPSVALPSRQQAAPRHCVTHTTRILMSSP
jgi:hypothetical protein